MHYKKCLKFDCKGFLFYMFFDLCVFCHNVSIANILSYQTGIHFLLFAIAHEIAALSRKKTKQLNEVTHEHIKKYTHVSKNSKLLKNLLQLILIHCSVTQAVRMLFINIEAIGASFISIFNTTPLVDNSRALQRNNCLTQFLKGQADYKY